MTTSEVGIKLIPDGKLMDFIDEKLRNDTPEEYVRQNIERRLVLEHKYLREQIEIEYSISMGSSKKRVDIAVFDEGKAHLQENIKIIIECKKETIEPINKNNGTKQLKSYMAACKNCKWGLWTNGIAKTVYFYDESEEKFVEMNDIPSKDGSLKDIDRPDRTSLKNATEDNLLFSFKTCHNHIYVNEGMQKQPAFFEFLKIIFCKIYDERQIPNDLEFYATSKERSSLDGQLTVKNRISKIFDNVKSYYPEFFENNDEIQLKSRTIAYIVSELQKYSFLDTNIDVKGKAYEQIVGANLRGDRGEFFTPRNIQKMAIKMLNIKNTEKLLDPACGTGGFLVNSMNFASRDIKKDVGRLLKESDSNNWGLSTIENYRRRISDLAQENYFGIDINPDLAKATKMNMVMNNDGSGNIFRQNSLLPPHEWDKTFKEKFIRQTGMKKGSFRTHKDIAIFDVIATNPPFGSKLPVKDPNILCQYDLAHKWKKIDDKWTMDEQSLQSSVPPEILFIERCWQFLKPGGRFAIVLPDSILGSPGLEYVREWIIKNCRIVASIDLHQDTFQPRNGTQTSILILQKKTVKEINQINFQDYNIFMAIVDRIGHDKRGNNTYRRDDYGNIIYVPEDKDVVEIDATSGGTTTFRQGSKKPLQDDETMEIAENFLEWKKKEVLGW